MRSVPIRAAELAYILNREGGGGVVCVCVTENSTNILNRISNFSLLVHPLLLYTANGGPSSSRRELALTLGNMNIGGMKVPAAFIHVYTVTRIPR